MSAKVCEHISSDNGVSQNLHIDRVLQAQVQPTEALASCRVCGAGYLLELIDMQTQSSLYRVANVQHAEYATTVANLAKGSCDIHRSTAEVAHLASRATPVSQLLISRRGHFSAWQSPKDKAPVLTPQDSGADLA
ncbi:MAG: hypothetical protein AAF993_10315 [Pseudomonadota bacterium]